MIDIPLLLYEWTCDLHQAIKTGRRSFSWLGRGLCHFPCSRQNWESKGFQKPLYNHGGSSLRMKPNTALQSTDHQTRKSQGLQILFRTAFPLDFRIMNQQNSFLLFIIWKAKRTPSVKMCSFHCFTLTLSLGTQIISKGLCTYWNISSYLFYFSLSISAKVEDFEWVLYYF